MGNRKDERAKCAKITLYYSSVRVEPYIPKYLYYEGPVFRGFCKIFWTKDRRDLGTKV